MNEIAGPVSKSLFETAKKLLPGGVASPVRAIQPYPFYTVSASGSHLTTVEGTTYIDCCLGYGPLLLGHKNPVVKKAIEEQLENGWLFGTPSEREIQLAQLITRDYPSMDMLRFVSTGCEATMSAIRLARGFTGKSGIVKVKGGFHGAHDSMLVSAGSGAASRPDSLGIPPQVTDAIKQVSYNNAEELETVLSANDSIAAFIIEPVLGNCGVIPPDKNYLNDIREITRAHDVLLIFDEVITGYRLGLGGAQNLFGITPDLTTLGKIVGGGLPIGVFGGRRDIMELVAPNGNVYNAGTFNANPLSMAAGIAAVSTLHDHVSEYDRLYAAVNQIKESLPSRKQDAFVSCGPMFKYFFRPTAPKNYAESKESDTTSFRRFWEHSLKKGVFLPPSQFESNFLSFAHSQNDIDTICEVYACL